METNFMSEWSCDACLLAWGGQGGRWLGMTSASHRPHMEERRRVLEPISRA